MVPYQVPIKLPWQQESLAKRPYILALVAYIWKTNSESPIFYWVVPEKIHTPPTDGILEILAGGGVKDPGNPGGGGGGGLNSKKSSAGVIWTDSSRDSNV